MSNDFSRSFREQPPLAFPRGTPEQELHGLERGWWRRVVLDAVPEFPQFDAFFNEVYEFFRGREAWRLFDDVLPTLAELKNRGLRLAIISNYDSRIDDLLRNFEIERFFDGVHISTRTGAAKPEKDIFLAALRYHQVDPRSALHVGDSLREDFEGASAAGIRAVLLDRNRSFGLNHHPERITRLDQLIDR